MTSPLKFDVGELLNAQGADALPEQRTQTGPAPERIGVEMIAIPKGEELTVDATLTPLGAGVLVDANVSGRLTGECSRCLKELHPELDLHVTQVFAADESFVSGDDPAADDEGSGDEIPEIEDDELDLLQAVIDEAGLNLPFAPVCEDRCEIDTPEGVTTGISGEEEEDKVDPRWAGLEKFL
ncbi:YceD family protein [Corynebacterium tuberculostearicum]|uniref:YceD family protein n=1 Tax=Corynebacterium tuberculostearicum TaxID=38304 RepID=UPI0029348526|nr:YceD family protein [Corynebacterium tuberculostearicum]MDV2420892.1 YceD family protein [Corynebacterium tuberculostearicum]